MSKKEYKPSLNPGAMLLAVILIFIGIAISVLALINFSSMGIFWGTITLISGITTSSMAITAIVTGKQEWILLDIITHY